MKIAIASDDNRLSSHFGHCSNFFIYKVENNNATFVEKLTPPPHEPGVIPNWLIKQDIDSVLTGGIGPKAKAIFESKGIKVYDGILSDDVEVIAKKFAEGKLEFGRTSCDHTDGYENKHSDKHKNCRDHI